MATTAKNFLPLSCEPICQPFCSSNPTYPSFSRLLVEFYLDNISPIDPAGQKMSLEQVEEQITLAAAPNAGDDLDKAVALSVNESIQTEVASDDHKLLRV